MTYTFEELYQCIQNSIWSGEISFSLRWSLLYRELHSIKIRRGRRGLRRMVFRSRKVCQLIQNKIRGVKTFFSTRESLLVHAKDNLQVWDRIIIYAQSNFRIILRANQETFTCWKKSFYAPDFILNRLAYIRRSQPLSSQTSSSASESLMSYSDRTG